ncbi:MAG TPA: MFS transporter [Acidobacteriaceae bacterium]|nr:MFS transporter [Acidobacteriaceae bacterium]
MTSTPTRDAAGLRACETRLTYAGWRVAAICHIGVLTGFATVFIYSFSFIVQPLHDTFGWNREQIARAFSLAAISVAFGSPLIGRLFDRYDPRKLITAFMVAFGLGIAGLAFLTPHLLQFYANAVLIGIAGTGTYQLGYARIIAGWFDRKLGAALSIVVAGSGVGSFVVPPLVQHLIATCGWRHTYLCLAAFPLLVGAPLTFAFARTPGATHRAEAPVNRDTITGLRWSQALASLPFWLLALGVCALSLSENGALAHLAPMLNQAGLPAREVAFTASLLGIASITGRFTLGWLLDYVKGSLLAVGSLLAAGSGMFLLAHAHTFAAAGPAAFVAGLGGGCELDLIPYMLRRYFGLRDFSALYGLVYTAFALAGAAAPLILGHVFDATGSYIATMNLFCGVTLLAAFAMFALPAYRFTAYAALIDEGKTVTSESILAQSIPKEI